MWYAKLMSNLIGVKEAAELLGVSTKTIRRWEESGKIRSTRTEGGHRRFNVSELLGNKSDASLTVAYARVSSHDQKPDLDRQSMVLEAYCAKQGWSFELIKDLGSGDKQATTVSLFLSDGILPVFGEQVIDSLAK